MNTYNLFCSYTSSSLPAYCFSSVGHSCRKNECKKIHAIVNMNFRMLIIYNTVLHMCAVIVLNFVLNATENTDR
jgi:hypothetical protein